MNKKIMLLALAALSAALFALPAVASAEGIPLHLNPTPEGPKVVEGGTAKLTTTSGLTVTCNEVGGSATFASGGTTGTMSLTFKGDCRENLFGSTCNSTGEPSGSIQTTTLPFHLVTLPNNKPGVLVTPATGTNHFATFICAGGFVTTTVNGNGVIGTITSPACGAKSTSAVISFKATSPGQQEHKKIAGTETIYDLTSGGNTAAQEATGTVTMGTSTELVCT